MRHYGGVYGFYNLPFGEQLEILGMYKANQLAEEEAAEQARLDALEPLIGVGDDDAEARARRFQVA